MQIEFHIGRIEKGVLNFHQSAPLLGCTSANQLKWQRCVFTRTLKFEEAFRCSVGKASWAKGAARAKLLKWKRPVPTGVGLSWVLRVSRWGLVRDEVGSQVRRRLKTALNAVTWRLVL